MENEGNTTSRKSIDVTQELTYSKRTQERAILIKSPARKDLTSLDIVMHARTDGYWNNWHPSFPIKVKLISFDFPQTELFLE